MGAHRLVAIAAGIVSAATGCGHIGFEEHANAASCDGGSSCAASDAGPADSGETPDAAGPQDSASVTQTFTVGGTLSGLSGTLVLRDNGGNDLTISSNGAFAFTGRLASGSPYNVSVATQPTGQTCTVANGSGTVGTTDVTTVAVTCSANVYTVGGTVSGLTGTVVLSDNGSDSLTISANGSFTFTNPVAYSSTYSVTVATQPSGQSCTVARGAGTMGAGNVTNVAVTCSASTYTVGGMVSGLSGSVVLTDNGTDNLTVSSNGAFTFATALATGQMYSVAIATQPTGATCSIANGSGTIGTSNVTNVSVTCSSTALVQVGSVVESTGGITLTLPSTKAGDLLVATIALNGCGLTWSGGTWTEAVQGIVQTNCAICWAAIWYTVSTGGTQTFTVMADAAAPVIGQMSEWKGFAASPLDQIGSATSTNGSSLTVTTTASTAYAAELGITAYCQAATGATTFTPGAGWTVLGNNGTSSSAIHFASDYQTSLPIGSASETLTSSQTSKWAGGIATFHP